MNRPWIRVIEPEQAQGRLREIYEDTVRRRGQLAEVHKIHSLNPESLRTHMEFYLALMFGQSPLHRRVREIIGVAVSRTNGCAYCVRHHSDALAKYEKRPEKMRAVQEGLWEDLDPKDAAICRFVEKLTLTPSAMTEEDVVILRDAGMSDEEILDAVQIAAYFNFVNRMVLGLGVHLESPRNREDFKY